MGGARWSPNQSTAVTNNVECECNLAMTANTGQPARISHSTAGQIASVIIVNYNGAHLLHACLAGLTRQSLPSRLFHIVVVDNASVDPSRDLLVDEFPEVRLLVCNVNRGFAGGNNVALREITTKYAVLLNNDAVPEPSWLERLLAPLEADETGSLVATSSKTLFMPRFVKVHFRTKPFRPRGLDQRVLGARICRVLVDHLDVTNKVLFENATFGPEGPSASQYRWSFPSGIIMVPMPVSAPEDAEHEIEFVVATRPGVPITFSTEYSTDCVFTASEFAPPTTARLMATGRDTKFDVVNSAGGIVFADGSAADRGSQEIDRCQYDKAEMVFTACGNGVAMRMQAAREVGFFDERYFMYYEDVDLSWRLRARGGNILYVPDAVLRHVHCASSTPWSPLWTFQVERNRLVTLTKDATGTLAGRAVGRFICTTVKMALHAVVTAAQTGRRPAVGHLVVRGKVLASYGGMLPGLLRSRRQFRALAIVDRRELEKWLVVH